MKARWIWGAIIVVLIAGNLTMGATLIGINLQRHFHPFSVPMKNIKALPRAESKAIRRIAKQETPPLRQTLKEARAARDSLAAYLAGPDYNRAEAQRRFDDLRMKTAQSQLIAQAMFLDMADKLPPADRAKLLDAQANKP